MKLCPHCGKDVDDRVVVKYAIYSYRQIYSMYRGANQKGWKLNHDTIPFLKRLTGYSRTKLMQIIAAMRKAFGKKVKR